MITFLPEFFSWSNKRPYIDFLIGKDIFQAEKSSCLSTNTVHKNSLEINASINWASKYPFLYFSTIELGNIWFETLSEIEVILQYIKKN